MAIRELKIFPDEVLRTECAAVEAFDETLVRLLDDLAQSMYAHKGVGLAAPQIGTPLRAIVVDVEQREGKPRLVELVNPEILESSPELFEWEEGCLSFPGEGEKISRPVKVRVRAHDRRGEPFEVEAEKLFSIALQHEIDHLDGVLFIDHLSRLKRSLISRRMKKRAKTAAS